MSFLGKRSTCPVGRDASRRRAESDVLTDLVRMLPLQSGDIERVTQMKGLKVATQYFRLQQFIQKKGDKCQKNLEEQVWMNSLFQNQSKLLMALDSKGIIVYVSERITSLLGLYQIDLIGVHYEEVIHSLDKESIEDLLRGSKVHAAVVRMKDDLTTNSTEESDRSAYRVMYMNVLGHCDREDVSFTVLECEPIEKVSILEIGISTAIELVVEANTRVIIGVDWKFELVTGYSRNDVLGKTLLVFTFPEDKEFSTENHQRMLKKVQSDGCTWRPPHRAQSSRGEWHWVRTCIRPGRIRKGKLLDLKSSSIVCSESEVNEFARKHLSQTSQLPSPPMVCSSQSMVRPAMSRSLSSSVGYSSLPSMSDLPNYSPQSASSPSSMQSSAEVSSCSVDAQLQPMAGVEDIFQTLHTSNSTPQSLDPLPELFEYLSSSDILDAISSVAGVHSVDVNTRGEGVQDVLYQLVDTELHNSTHMGFT